MKFTFSTKLQTDGLQLYQKYAPLQLFSKVFAAFEFFNSFQSSISQKTY